MKSILNSIRGDQCFLCSWDTNKISAYTTNIEIQINSVQILLNAQVQMFIVGITLTKWMSKLTEVKSFPLLSFIQFTFDYFRYEKNL